jgi:hypothetical protein
VVVVEEEAEGVLVTAAGELDQGDQPLAVGLVLLGGGGQVGVVVPAAAGDGHAVRRGLRPENDGACGRGEGGFEREGSENCLAEGVKPSRNVSPTRQHRKTPPCWTLSLNGIRDLGYGWDGLRGNL